MQRPDTLRRRRHRGGHPGAGSCLPPGPTPTPRGRLRAGSDRRRRLGPQFRHALADRPAVRRDARSCPAEPVDLARGPVGLGRIWHRPTRARCTWPTARTRHRSSGNTARLAARHGEPIELLDPSAVLRAGPVGAAGGSPPRALEPEEICVDPREVVAELPRFLETIGVEFRFDDPVADVRTNVVTSRSGRIEAESVWVCSGDELRVLFPDLLRQSGLVRCKLQMMRSQPFGDDWTLGPMLAAGLTLRHYAAFRDCPSLGESERPSRPGIPVARPPGASTSWSRRTAGASWPSATRTSTAPRSSPSTRPRSRPRSWTTWRRSSTLRAFASTLAMARDLREASRATYVILSPVRRSRSSPAWAARG